MSYLYYRTNNTENKDVHLFIFKTTFISIDFYPISWWNYKCWSFTTKYIKQLVTLWFCITYGLSY